MPNTALRVSLKIQFMKVETNMRMKYWFFFLLDLHQHARYSPRYSDNKSHQTGGIESSASH